MHGKINFNNVQFSNGIDNDELLCDLSGLPISSIALNVERAGYEAAEMLAFSSSEHLSKYFKRETGMTPEKWYNGVERFVSGSNVFCGALVCLFCRPLYGQNGQK